LAAAAVALVAVAHRGAGEMSIKRSLRHLLTMPWRVRRAFSTEVLDAITAAVRACEQQHAGEIRFAIEAALPLHALWHGQTSRQRAEQVFAEQRVWDTDHNNVVLIYVLFADRSVEIVADRGVGNARVPRSEWDACCAVIAPQFASGQFAAGAIAGVEAVAAVLARYPPALMDAGNELPDAPVLL